MVPAWKTHNSGQNACRCYAVRHQNMVLASFAAKQFCLAIQLAVAVNFIYIYISEHSGYISVSFFQTVR